MPLISDSENSPKLTLEQIENVTNAAGVGLWDWHIADQRVYYNEAWASMLGLSTKDLSMTTEDWESRVHPDDLAGAWASAKACLSGETAVHDHIHRMRHASGKWITTHVRAQVIERDADGQPTRMGGSQVDASASLAAQRFGLSDDSSDIALWEWQVTTGRLRVDGHCAAIMGDGNGPLSMSVDDCIERTHPEDQSHLRETLDALTQGSISHYELIHRIRHADGHWVHVRAQGRVLECDKDGKALLVAGSLVDISQSLRDQHRFDNIAEAAQIGLWEWNIKSDAVRYTAPWADAIGLSPDELSNTLEDWSSRVHPLDQPRFYDELQAIRDGKQLEYNHIHRVRHVDGEWIYIHAKGSVVERDAEGQPLQMSGVIMEVTETMQLQQALREALDENNTQAQLLRSIIDSLPGQLWVKDVEDRYMMVNSPFEEFYGKNEIDLIGKTAAAHTSSAMHQIIHQRDKRALRGDMSERVNEEVLIPGSKGDLAVVETTRTLLRDQYGKVIGLLGFHFDIKARKELERRLKISNTVLSHIEDHVLVLSMENRIIFANEAAKVTFDISTYKTAGLPASIVHQSLADPALLYQAIDQIKATGYWESEVPLIDPLGRQRIDMVRGTLLHDDHGDPSGVMLIGTDITERVAQREQLKHMAHHDPLTLLPNRTLLNDRLDHAMQRSQRTGFPIAVLFIDLDGFKQINDEFGHEAGDEMLRRLSRRQLKALRSGDTIARLGGDEFVAILENIASDDLVEEVATRLLSELSREVKTEFGTMTVSASIGIAHYPAEGIKDFSQLLILADNAMYAAKKAGKNRFYIADDNDLKQVVDGNNIVDFPDVGA